MSTRGPPRSSRGSTGRAVARFAHRPRPPRHVGALVRTYPQGTAIGFVWVLDPDGTVAENHLPMLVECAELRPKPWPMPGRRP
jgi:alkylated DNA nucleotide flippase Atl1